MPNIEDATLSRLSRVAWIVTCLTLATAAIASLGWFLSRGAPPTTNQGGVVDTLRLERITNEAVDRGLLEIRSARGDESSLEEVPPNRPLWDVENGARRR